MKLAVSHLPERLLLPVGVMGLYVAVGYFYLKNYLLWDSQWLLALVLLPLVTQVQSKKSLSPVLLLSATALALLAAHQQSTTLYFFALLVTIWCGVQLLIGRISLYPLLLLTVASPIFKYIADILSFPLRLQLTSWSVQMLQVIGKDAEAAGNIILVNGEDFSVDPACAGLSMLSLSLILAVFILAHLQQRTQKQWPHWLLYSMLGFMLLLNLLSNLLRILLLVLFKVLPDNPMHDIIGLLCLLFYALLLFFFSAKELHQRFSKEAKQKQTGKSVSIRGALLLNTILILMMVASGVNVQQKKPLFPEQKAAQLSGFERESFESGVTKYSNKEVLVYLKPVPAFYSTEHHPLICWEGSGYTFRHVQSRKIGNHILYVGELQKGADKLYTAWWMDNGRHRTIDQWDWRWRMFKGEAKFRLVNVTVAQQEELTLAVGAVMEGLVRSGFHAGS